MAKDRGNTATMTTPTTETDEEIFNSIVSISENASVVELRGKETALSQRRTEAVQHHEQAERQRQELGMVNAEIISANALLRNSDAELSASSREMMNQQLLAAQHELASIDKALHLLERQLMQAESEASASACRAVAVERLHRKNNRRTVNALLGLIAAQDRQQQIHAELNRRGHYRTSYLGTNFFVSDFGRLDDCQSWVSSLLRDAMQEGLISEAERIGISRGEMTAIDENA